eukprot:GHVS01032649.1.p1 GENE.GHVS01032649.1~~GHVS01032649.1.p1  ORF type:complete len:342 (+),score=67.52 GHVS01032649.1:24-1028(+)
MSLLLDIQRTLPKVELHAHLFGCVRRDRLVQYQTEEGEEEGKKPGGEEEGASSLKSLEDAFTYFEKVYKYVNNKKRVKQVMCDVLEDFQKDGVVYAEIRTTLKCFPDMSCTEYIRMLSDSIEQSPIEARIIISLNRERLLGSASTSQEVEQILKVAKHFPGMVVGVDIAGNPRKGDIREALQMFSQLLPKHNLKLTVHTAEVENSAEVDAILAAKPNRIGHACFLNKHQQKKVEENKVVVEMCPTSNMLAMQLADLRDHHFAGFWTREHTRGLAVLCTDDTGLFETTLSDELFKMAQAFDLTIAQLKQLQLNALTASFAPQHVVEGLINTHFRT